jgi:serine/threonine protein kinase
MDRLAKSTQAGPTPARPEAVVELVTSADIAVIGVQGLVDERFRGFGTIGAMKTVVINVGGITRMTSFGVRQWLKAMDQLPKSITDLFLIGCPTFFVDQLNMVLNFGGSSKVLTVVAPFACPSCGQESGETIDVLAERSNLANGGLPTKECARCGGQLEFNETPESYFSFVSKYGAASIPPATAEVLAAQGLYASRDNTVEKPPKIIKLVHGSVTYFRIIGRIGSMFRARPFLVGAEGEVVIDLAEVDQLDPAGHKEWQRLLKSLTGQVPAVTLVDLKETFLASFGDMPQIARNLIIASLLVPYVCLACGKRTAESRALAGRGWPPHFEGSTCPACGTAMRHEISGGTLVRLKNANTMPPPATEQLIAQRGELVAKALSESNAAAAHSESSPGAAANDDAILGKYKIVRRMSPAGMIEMFLAKQVGIGGFEKPVVLKKIKRRLLESHQRAVDVFLNQVNVAARLTHPNIVQVLDVGEVDGAIYLATEYVHGKNLRDLIERMHVANLPMPVAEAVQIAREVAQAVDHAFWSTDMNGQPLSVVHGDISPHNIILSYDGSVKVIDFGVAISASDQVDVQYMAPEFAMNEALDHRSDLFSIGVLLYHLCSGTVPFSGGSQKDIVKKIRAGRYRPLHEVANVPDVLVALVTRLLSANPDERPRRGQDVAAELADIARRCNLSSSGGALAKFMTKAFPDDVKRPTEDAFTAEDTVQSPAFNPDAMIAMPRTSSRSLPGVGIDASVSLMRNRNDPSSPVIVNKTAKSVKPVAPSSRGRLALLLAVLVIAFAIGATAVKAYLVLR